MPNESLVSIIIPYFRGPGFLKEAVASALGQAYSQIEVIVVDDCSLEEKAQAALSAFTDSRIRIISHEKNRGAAAARNTAGMAARGQFILPLDADDRLDPRYVQATIPYLADPKIGGVYTAVKSFGGDEAIYAQDWTVSGIVSGESGALICMLYRKELFDQLGGYDVRWRVGEDSDFYLRAVAKGWEFKRLEEVLYYYRKHDSSVTSNHAAESQTEMAQNLLRYHGELCREHLDRIVTYKDERYWKLIAEYKHLHTEFHKLLELYTNLHENVSKESSRSAKLIGKIRRLLRPKSERVS